MIFFVFTVCKMQLFSLNKILDGYHTTDQTILVTKSVLGNLLTSRKKMNEEVLERHVNPGD